LSPYPNYRLQSQLRFRGLFHGPHLEIHINVRAIELLELLQVAPPLVLWHAQIKLREIEPVFPRVFNALK